MIDFKTLNSALPQSPQFLSSLNTSNILFSITVLNLPVTSPISVMLFSLYPLSISLSLSVNTFLPIYCYPRRTIATFDFKPGFYKIHANQFYIYWYTDSSLSAMTSRTKLSKSAVSKSFYTGRYLQPWNTPQIFLALSPINR